MCFNSLPKDLLWLILRRVILEECVESDDNYYNNIDNVVSCFQTTLYLTSNYMESNNSGMNIGKMVCGIVRNLRYVCKTWRSLLRQKCLPSSIGNGYFKFRPGSFL